MENSIVIDGRTFISSRRVAEIVKYSKDYVAQLCRMGKINAKRIDRSWFVDMDSVVSHQKATEQQLKNVGHYTRSLVSTDLKRIIDEENRLLKLTEIAPIEIEIERPTIVSDVKVEVVMPLLSIDPIEDRKVWVDHNGYFHEGEKPQPAPLLYSRDDRPLLPFQNMRESYHLRPSRVHQDQQVKQFTSEIARNRAILSETKNLIDDLIFLGNARFEGLRALMNRPIEPRVLVLRSAMLVCAILLTATSAAIFDSLSYGSKQFAADSLDTTKTLNVASVISSSDESARESSPISDNSTAMKQSLSANEAPSNPLESAQSRDILKINGALITGYFSSTSPLSLIASEYNQSASIRLPIALQTQIDDISNQELLAVNDKGSDLLPMQSSADVARPSDLTANIEKAAEALKGFFSEINVQSAHANHIDSHNVASVDGFNMTDQATKQIYCVTIRNGDWDKEIGQCATP